MKSTSVRLRPFNVGGAFEVKLPGGQSMLFDPFFTGNRFEGGHTREDVEGADYILLTHSHFDHDIDLGYFVERFGSKVFCGVMAAEEVLKYHRVPYDNLFPVYPGSRYTLPHFTLEVFQAKHNPSGGNRFDPDCAIAESIGVTGHGRCDQLGFLESMDYRVTTPNGFSILMASGRAVWEELFEDCRRRGPNLLLRQAGMREEGGDLHTGKQVEPQVLAQLLTRYRAQVIFPFHQDVMVKRWGQGKVDEYFARVAEEVRRLDPGAAFVNPRAWRWYDIGIHVAEEAGEPRQAGGPRPN